MNNPDLERKQRLAKEKLADADQLFAKFENTLSGTKTYKKNSRLDALKRAAALYDKGSYYDACIELYNVFHVTKDKYPMVAAQLKEKLKEIVNRYFKSKDRSKITESKNAKSIQASLF